jgi:hypothetical protein
LVRHIKFLVCGCGVFVVGKNSMANPASLAEQLQTAEWTAELWSALPAATSNHEHYVMRILSRRLSNHASNPNFLNLTNDEKREKIEKRTKDRIEGYISSALRNCKCNNMTRSEDWNEAIEDLESFLNSQAVDRYNIFLPNGNGGRTDAHGTFRCEGRFGEATCVYGHIGNIYWCEEDFVGFDCWQLDHQFDQQFIRGGVEDAMVQCFDQILDFFVMEGCDWIDAISQYVNVNAIAQHCFGRYDALHPDGGGLKIVFKVCHETTEHVHANANYLYTL